jgi:hypothetical protein
MSDIEFVSMVHVTAAESLEDESLEDESFEEKMANGLPLARGRRSWRSAAADCSAG